MTTPTLGKKVKGPFAADKKRIPLLFRSKNLHSILANKFNWELPEAGYALTNPDMKVVSGHKKSYVYQLYLGTRTLFTSCTWARVHTLFTSCTWAQNPYVYLGTKILCTWAQNYSI
jgi:hypothetical protein